MQRIRRDMFRSCGGRFQVSVTACAVQTTMFVLFLAALAALYLTLVSDSLGG